jgi:hypothetical protein
VGLYNEVHENVQILTGDGAFLDLDFDPLIYLNFTETGRLYFD